MNIPSEALVSFVINLTIAIVIFILGILAHRAYDFIYNRIPYYKIWGFERKSEINVVTGNIRFETDASKSDSDYSALMASGDIDALVEVISSLKLIYPKAKIRRFFTEEYPERVIDENLITIGGPVWNTVTRRVLETIKSPLYFDKNLNLIDLISKQEYETTEKDGKPVKDYGIVLKIPNPYDKDNCLILIAGCDTYGVLAGSKCISYLTKKGHEFVHKISKSIGFLHIKKYFAAIVSADIVKEDVFSVKIIKFYQVHLKDDGNYLFVLHDLN